jgi:hypothetical protein
MQPQLDVPREWTYDERRVRSPPTRSRSLRSTPPTSRRRYVLPDGASVYAEVGTWTAGQTAQVRQPFRIDVPIDRLTPRPAEVG